MLRLEKQQLNSKKLKADKRPSAGRFREKWNDYDLLKKKLKKRSALVNEKG